jgi:hypothetical protein
MALVNVPDVLNKLVTIGYLDRSSGGMDRTAVRAVQRFQRHAGRTYRMPQPDVSAGQLFTGKPTGNIDIATANEVDKWVSRGWKVPIGRFPTTSLSQGGRLRSDAAAAWEKVVGLVAGVGGTLEGPYGDTTRPVRPNSKVGASRYSFHYAGRAIDINQKLAGGKDQRYFIAKENVNSNTFWRIYCKTAIQDGSQGQPYAKGSIRCYSFTQWTEYDLPAGDYIDLTYVIQSTNEFERIKAQSNWSGAYNKTEWWHFQYALGKQETFSDELELVGYSEAHLRRAGWGSDVNLDHRPG